MFYVDILIQVNLLLITFRWIGVDTMWCILKCTEHDKSAIVFSFPEGNRKKILTYCYFWQILICLIWSQHFHDNKRSEEKIALHNNTAQCYMQRDLCCNKIWHVCGGCLRYLGSGKAYENVCFFLIEQYVKVVDYFQEWT